MNANERFEIVAQVFQHMRGHLAPGKDSPAAAGTVDIEERNAVWEEWCGQCLWAVNLTIDAINEDKK